MNFHKIQHLTKDSEGFVFWRGVRVEHYSFRDPEKEQVAAEQLAQECEELERRGVVVTSRALMHLQNDNYLATLPKWAVTAAAKIMSSYGITGLCDTGHIANVIVDASQES